MPGEDSEGGRETRPEPEGDWGRDWGCIGQQGKATRAATVSPRRRSTALLFLVLVVGVVGAASSPLRGHAAEPGAQPAEGGCGRTEGATTTPGSPQSECCPAVEW